jgi:hypothetical protein
MMVRDSMLLVQRECQGNGRITSLERHIVLATKEQEEL